MKKSDQKKQTPRKHSTNKNNWHQALLKYSSNETELERCFILSSN